MGMERTTEKDEDCASRNESWRDVGGHMDESLGADSKEGEVGGEEDEEEDEEGDDRLSDSSSSVSSSLSESGRPERS